MMPLTDAEYLALSQFMRSAANSSFRWGENDCFCYAANAVKAVTGKDHMAELRGYDSPMTAAILMRERFGTLSLRSAFLQVAERAGAMPIPKLEVRDGDVICYHWPVGARKVTELDQSCGLGIFFLNHVWLLGPKGIIKRPLDERVIDIWRF